ncbi:hypothetical protein ALCH109712_09510 [Alkalicoccus chagannorensis]
MSLSFRTTGAAPLCSFQEKRGSSLHGIRVGAGADARRSCSDTPRLAAVTRRAGAVTQPGKAAVQELGGHSEERSGHSAEVNGHSLRASGHSSLMRRPPCMKSYTCLSHKNHAGEETFRRGSDHVPHCSTAAASAGGHALLAVVCLDWFERVFALNQIGRFLCRHPYRRSLLYTSPVTYGMVSGPCGRTATRIPLPCLVRSCSKVSAISPQ